MRRLMTQKIGSTFIPYEDIFFGYGIAVTIVAPNGSDTANIRMWGAGGGGGGGTANLSASGFGSGGGGGGFTIKKGLSVTGGSSTLVITPGAPGANASFPSSRGSNGGNTTITGAITLTSTGGGGALGTTSVGSAGTKDASGDVGSENGNAGNAAVGSDYGYGGNTGGLSFVTVSGGGVANTGVPPGAGGRGGFYSSFPLTLPSISGKAGLVKVRWTKSNGSNTAVYKIYNIPLTFISPDPSPTYNTCSAQQIYTTTTGRLVWETQSATITGASFYRAFVANTSTSTCDFDSTTSTFTVRIRDNSNADLTRSYFSSVILPNGTTFDTSSADFLYDNISYPGDIPPYTATFDCIWTWANVPDSILSAGANQNIRFKV